MTGQLILRCAALLAPGAGRAEWLAEWDGEAAYVHRACGSAAALRFCLGAFRDALWLRRNSPRRTAPRLASPIHCLAVLGSLAAVSVIVLAAAGAFRWLGPVNYRDRDRLAMVTRKISLEEFRGLHIPQAADAAIYAPKLAWANSRRFLIAVASPNLFRLLGISAPSTGLVVRGSALHRIGRTVEVDDSPVAVAGTIPDEAWQLPGFIDGWLLDDSRVSALPAASKAFLVVRFRDPLPRRLTAAGGFTFAPLPREDPLGALFIVTIFTVAIFLSVTPFGLGAYASNRHPFGIRIRRWLFMTIKIALLIPIVVCVTFGLVALPVSPQAFIMGSIFALRWAVADQRSRCPVCLHALTEPVRMGEASHTFLDWYGTEFVCTRGHGFLHVAEIRSSCFPEQRWLAA